MSKSTFKPAGNAKPQQAQATQEQSNAAAEEQRQTQHRTAIRIAGIEGIEGFADLAQGDDQQLHQEKA